MKKVNIGYIFISKKMSDEERLFLRIAKKKNISLILFNLADKIVEKEIEEKARQCNVIFNDVGDFLAVELVKTLEELGKKVVDSSKVYYYSEDKWMFFLKCKEHHLPVPETILLSGDLNSAKKELNDFAHWPVVLKRVLGERGEFVEKADNPAQAISTIRHFWKKGNERLPVIAQEFIKSPSYRVTVIGNKIVQSAVKDCHGWKATGVYATEFRRFKVDNELKKIIKKLISVCRIEISGIDFFKKDGKWLVLEINAEPSFRFFDNEKEKLIGCVLDYLKKQCKP